MMLTMSIAIQKMSVGRLPCTPPGEAGDIARRIVALHRQMDAGGCVNAFYSVSCRYSLNRDVAYLPWILANGGGNANGFRNFLLDTPEETSFPFFMVPWSSPAVLTCAASYCHRTNGLGLCVVLSFSHLLSLFEDPHLLVPAPINFLEIAAGHVGVFRAWIRAQQLPMLVAGPAAAWWPRCLRADDVPPDAGYVTHVFSPALPPATRASGYGCTTMLDCPTCLRWGAELCACLGISAEDGI